MIISENRQLTASQKERVLARAWERGFACPRCGSRDFSVGDALEMGFLFLSEEHGSFMVALTCEECWVRTGIRLQESEFLRDE